MDSVNIKNFNTLKTMDKIFSIPPGPKHIVEAANYLYGTENEVGSKINETSAYNYFSGNGHDLTRILYSAYGIIQNVYLDSQMSNELGGRYFSCESKSKYRVQGNSAPW